jgi:hypothetical protein
VQALGRDLRTSAEGIPCLFTYRAEDCRSWPSLTHPYKHRPRPFCRLSSAV